MFDAVCSFCGKNQKSVKKLIASPDNLSYICEGCIDICKEIIKEQETKNSQRFSIPTPKELKKKLDEYIVGQENAKKIMAVAVYNHYKRIQYNLSFSQDKVELDKSNLLLIGPTGVGKTLIAKTLAKILNVPFACVDATTLTEAGYVGDDVESVLSRLLKNADGDVKKAEMGIIYIDEIDKIAKSYSGKNLSRDVSGEGVQQSLLKILEGTTAQVMENPSRRHPNQDCILMNTTNILFICGGAFVSLKEIMNKNKNETSVGYLHEKELSQTQHVLSHNITPNDLIEFGLIPEFVGRLPVIIKLDDLDEKAMISILTEPKNNLVTQYKTIFKLDGVELDFDQKALSSIAQKALNLKIGARGLRSVMEEVMLDLMFELPNVKNNKKIVIEQKDVNSLKSKKYL